MYFLHRVSLWPPPPMTMTPLTHHGVGTSFSKALTPLPIARPPGHVMATHSRFLWFFAGTEGTAGPKKGWILLTLFRIFCHLTQNGLILSSLPLLRSFWFISWFNILSLVLNEKVHLQTMFRDFLKIFTENGFLNEFLRFSSDPFGVLEHNWWKMSHFGTKCQEIFFLPFWAEEVRQGGVAPDPTYEMHTRLLVFSMLITYVKHGRSAHVRTHCC